MNPAGYPQHLPADELRTTTSRMDAKSIRDAELGRLSRQYGAIVWWGTTPVRGGSCFPAPADSWTPPLWRRSKDRSFARWSSCDDQQAQSSRIHLRSPLRREGDARQDAAAFTPRKPPRWAPTAGSWSRKSFPNRSTTYWADARSPSGSSTSATSSSAPPPARGRVTTTTTNCRGLQAPPHGLTTRPRLGRSPIQRTLLSSSPHRKPVVARGRTASRALAPPHEKPSGPGQQTRTRAARTNHDARRRCT